MAPHRPAHGRAGMGSSSASSSATPASAADAEAAAAHAGFINLGNTCFLNSVLQAASVTTALRTLYHPPQEASGSSSSSPATELLAADSSAQLLEAAQRARSPVLRLVDEEKGRQAPAPPRFAAPAPFTTLDDAGAPSTSTSATATPRPAATPSASFIAPSTHVPSASDVPLNTAFRHTLEQTWPSANSNRHRRGGKVPAVNAKPLLGALIRKYSHYGDYGQQDGHELLVHLLDAMRMEEMDLIKKLQPATPSARRRPRPSRTATLAMTAQVEEEAHTPRATARADPLHALAPLPEEPKMRPFVDAVFGGKLLSAVVCEGCRHVSHTYEDFLDVSLPVRPESDTKGVKQRHSIRKMADRWRRGHGAKPPPRPRSAAETAQALQRLEDGQMSEAEADSTPGLLRGFSIARPKSAMPRPKAGISPAPSPHINGAGPTASEVEQMRKLLARGGGSDTDVESAAEGPSSSARVPDAAAMSLAPDFAAYSDAERAFATKHHAPPASSSGGLLRAVSGRMGGKSSEPPSRVSSPNPPSETESAAGARSGGEPMKRGASNRQGAYITRLFADVPRAEAPSGSAGFLWPRWAGTTAAAPAPSEAHLAARSRGTPATQADVLAAQAGTGLVKSLMQFTAVEALDGDNRYACKRCWRLANPLTPAERARQLRRRARRGEDDAESEKSEDDEEDSDAGEEEQPHQGIKVAVPTPIVANGTDTIKASHLPPPADDSRRGSASSLGETSGEDELQSITRSMPIPIIETSPATPAVATASPRWPGADGSLRAPQAIPGSLRTIAKTSTTGSEYATSDEESGDVTGSETEASTGRGTDSASDRGAPVDALRTLRVSSGAPRRRRSTQSIAQRALKRYLIASTPPVLVFHFKRFQHVNRTYGFSSFAGGSKKIDDVVSFPELLDIAPFVAPPREEYDRAGMLKASSDERALKKAAMLGGEVEEKRQKESHHRWHWHSRGRPETKPTSVVDGDAPSTRYRLYAVVMHQGTMSSGHYTAFVLAPPAPSTSSSSTTPAPTTSDSRRPSVASSPALGATSDAGSASIKSVSSASASGAAGADGADAARTMQPSTSEGTMASTTTSSSASSVRSSADAATPATTASSAATPASSVAGAAAAAAAVPDQRRWLFTSDSLVRPASIDEVLNTKHAYLLFYENVPADA